MSERWNNLQLHYRGHLYTLEGAGWRGRDGKVVHLLTWITDDLIRRAEAAGETRPPDLVLVREVARQLGSEAEVRSRLDPGRRGF